jgi:hypothetical protein
MIDRSLADMIDETLRDPAQFVAALRDLLEVGANRAHL